MIYTFEDVMREHMDYTDIDTVREISRCSLSESSKDQSRILASVTSKLYEKIVEKADKVDYTTVAKSKGDFTKVDNYTNLMECIDLIRELVIEYKQPTGPVDIVSEAVINLNSRVNQFKKAFAINSGLMIMTYNNISLGIINSVSFLIATCIEYIKTPNSGSFQIALDTIAYNRALDNILYKNLKLFNDSCKSGEFDQCLDMCLKQTKIQFESAEVVVKYDRPFIDGEESDKVVLHDEDDETIKESLVDVALAVPRLFIFLAKTLIYIIRDIVYYFYYTKQTISDYWATQAELLEMNAYKLQYDNTIDIADKQATIDKQLKIAAKYKARANKWSVDHKIATKNAETTKSAEAKKFAVEDLDDYNPKEHYNSSDSVLF